MGAPDKERRCGCGTKLARDNRAAQCSACRHQVRDLRARPPRVPLEFWQHPSMKQALSSWNIGQVIAAYRQHPHHGHPVPQEIAAHWVGVGQPRLSQIENGPAIQDLSKLIELAQLFQVPGELLWFRLPGRNHSLTFTGQTPLDGEALHAMADDVAAQSISFADRLAVPSLDDGTLEYLRWEIGRIAVNYVHAPLHTVFADLKQTRDEIFTLLDQGQRPDDARELNFLGGVTCLVLAHASQNAGNERAALGQLRAAWKLADVANNDSLRAWTRGTAALINEWSLHQSSAVDLAARGSQFPSSSESRLRLAAIEARSAARRGDKARARQALARLHDAQDKQDEPDDIVQFGGLLSFPRAKQQYYLGGIYTLLGDHDAAEVHAQSAITAYETGLPAERSYGDETLARLDIVNVRLARHDLDGAAEAATPVLELRTDLVIRQFELPIARTRELLAEARFAETTIGRELQDGFRHFQAQIRAAGSELPSP
jgi:transcriptional regulator with XRE-family HTH domain